jgi:chemotaxis-related protein WspB
MLFLLFQLGADRYAIEAGRVREVLPLVNLKQLPNAPPGIAGMMDYHAEPVPIIDLSQLTIGVPSRHLMSTRIILVNYPREPGDTRLLGLIAEGATETLRCAEQEFIDPGVSVSSSLYLGPVAVVAGSIVQKIEVEALLSPSVRSGLLQPMGLR